MRIKIDTHQIGLKEPISIVVNLNSADKVDEMTEKMTAFQIKAMEVNQADDPDSLETVKQSLAVNKELRQISKQCIDFLTKTLKLNAKQVQVMRRSLASRNALMDYTGYVCGQMQYPDVDLSAAKDDDPKKSPSPTSDEKSTKSK